MKHKAKKPARSHAELLQQHFDPAHYRREYPDLDGSDEALLDHYRRHGWREGRNPSAGFDTFTYVKTHPTAIVDGLDPFLHHLLREAGENSGTVPAASPSFCTLRLFGYRITDWVERLRPYVDPEFYARDAESAGISLDGVDPAAHFAFRGWREGLSPSARFDVATWLTAHPEVAAALVNPLIAALEWSDPSLLADSEGIASDAAEYISPPEDPAPVVADEAVLREEFSAAYYRRNYPRSIETGLDPLIHYLTIGWREGHNPNAKFDGSFYLRTNPDVVESGLNPFWHYITAGRREGRLCQLPGGFQRQAIDAAQAAAVPPIGRSAARIGGNDEIEMLLRRLDGGDAAGLVVSLSHDRYAESVGGVQILIADEQAKFNARRWRYLHLAPARPSLVLHDEDDGFAVAATLDGEPFGHVNLDAIARALAQRLAPDLARLLVVHSLLGFALTPLLTLARAFAAAKAFYWVHDYSGLCPGFTLLRNDSEHCHAPPNASLACRICVHGAVRPAHQALVARFFAAVACEIIAPSEASASLWRARTEHYAPVIVHPHWRLRRQTVVAAASDTSRSMRRLAFAGRPVPGKGWPSFRSLVDRLADATDLEFFHFATEPAAVPGVTFVRTQVSATSRHAMVTELRAQRIDAVMVLSPWPETFCFVAHEAIAAGAIVLCYDSSGNVASLVRQTGRGQVFANEDDLARFLEAGEGDALLAALDGHGRAEYVIEDTGTTATLLLELALQC